MEKGKRLFFFEKEGRLGVKKNAFIIRLDCDLEISEGKKKP